MLPTLAWIDFSEKDRRKMLDVVSLFKEQDTRDELGLGTVRDAIAETLFPGTTTIMTRARYFLFVPWIYLNRESILAREGRHYRTNTVAELGRRREVELIGALERGTREQHDAGGGDPERGIIGIEARARLQRLPSAIYWAGLGSWGIRRFPGSIYDYHRVLQGYDAERVHVLTDEDEQPVGDGRSSHWHPAIPEPSEDYLTTSTFTLRRDEATFLKERVLGTHPGTMLAHLLDHQGGGVEQHIEYPWLHPAWDGFPPHIRAQLTQGQLFALVTNGAALLYNLMLCEEVGNDAWITGYRERLTEWGDVIAHELPALKTWEPADLWRLVAHAGFRAPRSTRAFVESWTALVRASDEPAALGNDAEARQMIHHRERQLKGARARLSNPSRLDHYGGAAGTGILDYRWSTVRTLLDDILSGLGGSEHHA